MHYAGFACNMEKIKELADQKNIFIVEDAALALGTNYKGKPLGSFGHLSAFSFHETKNISCGEGGMLVINDERFLKRAEIIREKGTNRSAFFRGEVDKYGWTDLGSSFLPSDILAAYLYAQLEAFDHIQKKRSEIWLKYHKELANIPALLPPEEEQNGSIFYICCSSLQQRTALIAHLKLQNIPASFHYQALHKSTFFHSSETLPNAEKFSDCLLRLPLYPDLTNEQTDLIIKGVRSFFKN
jgi:dTDP-4-amino-4,6-dideoxygalactose transaminase